jgi:hypothetical protein
MMQLAAALLLVTTTAAWAIPPTFCRQQMVGKISSSDDGRYSRLRLQIRVTDFEGDFDVRGRFHCGRPANREQCPVQAASIAGNDVGRTADGFGRIFRLRLFALEPPHPVLCEIEASVPLVWNDCIPALSGTFVCSENGRETRRGTVALARPNSSH